MSGYTPDTRQRLTRAIRFFARPESFTLECPRCGKVYQIRMGRDQAYWDQSTSRFTCNAKGGCEKTYLLGLVAWPVSPRAYPATTPRDQVPNERQLAQLRSEGGGWWMPDSEKQRYSKVEESNLTLEEERPDDNSDDD